MSSPQRALEAFVDAEQNPDLPRLESLLTHFNLFEAVGVVRHELRHSDFLAYLLNPSQHHGLGADFLKELLQAVLLTTEGDSAVSPSDLDAWDMSQAVVQREWHHIDILVIDDVNRFAVLIENKVDTGEHSDQLNRYYAEFHSHYPGYKVVALFLTPDGEAPTSSDYQGVSYTLICEVIEKIVKDNRGALNGEIVMVLEHYAQMLRRHIVSDSDVAELCRSIYHKHRQALDLIFEHRPNQQAQIREYVKTLISKQPGLTSPSYGKVWVNFNLQEWEDSLTARGLSLHTKVYPYLSFQNQVVVSRVLLVRPSGRYRAWLSKSSSAPIARARMSFVMAGIMSFVMAGIGPDTSATVATTAAAPSGTHGSRPTAAPGRQQLQAHALAAYQERASMRGVCRLFGVGRNTLSGWLTERLAN